MAEVSEEIVARINDVLGEANRFLSIDNGAVEYVRLDPDGILRVRFVGSCAVCPLRPMTLRAGVERAILYKVAEVKRVELVPN